jgi:hypothetical protein
MARQSSRCLYVFVDEVGDEALPRQQRYFGLAALVARKQEFEQEVKPRWIASREIEKFHARKHYPGPPRRKRAILEFLRNGDFLRLGTCVSNIFGLAEDRDRASAVVNSLAHDLFTLLSVQQPRLDVDSCFICFEHSVRFSPKVFSVESEGFSVRDAAGNAVPLVATFVQKDFHEPGLQIADLLAYSICDRMKYLDPMGNYRSGLHPVWMTRG